ncbi:MAG TPA: hypothetical protein VL426_02990, partial [Candidatus Binatia bacterium]|nr:hypothetical protein [Candidatus Binatia bacterium]
SLGLLRLARLQDAQDVPEPLTLIRPSRRILFLPGPEGCPEAGKGVYYSCILIQLIISTIYPPAARGFARN